MSEADALSLLIQDIYDATLDPALWPTTLRRMSSFVGGATSSLFSKDAATRGGQIFYADGGITDDWMHRYTGEYVRYDPTSMRQFFAAPEQVLSTTDVMPYEEFTASRFYEEWAKPQNLIDSFTAVLDKSGTNITMFSVFRTRGDGLFEEAARQRLSLIVPHIRRAMLIGGTIEHTSLRQSALADTLDSMSAGIFLLDAEAHLVHLNVAGEELLEPGGPLAMASRRLVPVDRDVEGAIGAAIAAAVEGDGAFRRTNAAISLRDFAGQIYVAYVLPLGSELRRASEPSAVAVLFVRRAAFGGVAAPEALAKAYHLTPTELRVLLAVVEVGGGPAMADALGVAESTVKFHLRRLFEKTGARRQAELVKLVAGFSAP